MEASARWVLSRSCEGKQCNSQPSLVIHVFPEVTSVGPQRKSVYSCWTVCWPSNITLETNWAWWNTKPLFFACFLMFSPIINIKAYLKMLGLSAFHPQDWLRRVRTPYHMLHIHELGLRGNRICLGNNCQPFQRVDHLKCWVNNTPLGMFSSAKKTCEFEG